MRNWPQGEVCCDFYSSFGVGGKDDLDNTGMCMSSNPGLPQWGYHLHGRSRVSVSHRTPLTSLRSYSHVELTAGSDPSLFSVMTAGCVSDLRGLLSV